MANEANIADHSRTKPDGNPRAFPSGDFTGCEPGRGMTLRDWFAGQALAAIVAEAGTDALSDICQGIRAGAPLARGAYAIADAMLAERSRHA